MELKYELELYSGNYGRLAKAATAVETAMAAYNATVARTCTAQWERQLTAEGRQAWHDAQLAPVVAAEAAFDKEAGEAREAIAKARRMAEVEPRLGDADLARASSEATFAKEDIDHATKAEEIIKLVEDAKLSGQKARLWCLLRYAGQRLHRENEQVKAYMVAHQGQTPSTRIGIGTLELTKALQAASVVFADPASAELIEKAAALEKTIKEQLPRGSARRDEIARKGLEQAMRRQYAGF